MSDFRVVICGGGIAAVEGLLRLRRLAGDSVDIELIAPNDELVYRPMAVREPFAAGPARRYPLGQIAHDAGAHWAQDSLAWVEPDAHVVHTTEGRRVEYDALLIAVGAKQVEPYEHVATFRDADADAAYQGVVQDVEAGYSRSVAFIQPVGPVWPLPLYELALMTARWATDQGLRIETWLVTHEGRALGVFGPDVAAEVAERLETAGVRLWTGAFAQCVEDGRLWLDMEGGLPVDLAVALPRPMGRAIVGLPADEDGFIPVDAQGLVPDAPGVYAAGDATTRAMRQGGLATQQGDTAATAIAVQAGVEVEPETYRPVLRGMLLTGRRPQYLSRATGEVGHASDDAPWWPPHKIAGRHLAPYLAAHPELRETPVGHV
jgi:sulfide:quinone oxidoreductase